MTPAEVEPCTEREAAARGDDQHQVWRGSAGVSSSRRRRGRQLSAAGSFLSVPPQETAPSVHVQKAPCDAAAYVVVEHGWRKEKRPSKSRRRKRGEENNHMLVKAAGSKGGRILPALGTAKGEVLAWWHHPAGKGAGSYLFPCLSPRQGSNTASQGPLCSPESVSP